jgi:hypothetical protein
MFDLEEILKDLKEKRKVFHSEDDLKFSLGYLIKRSFSSFEIRLEKPVELNFESRSTKEPIKRRAPIDIVVITDDNRQIPIEIKYKTRSFSKEKKSKTATPFVIDAEQYDLSNQGASDLGRFNFRKDIVRIEKFISEKRNISNVGFCLLITNDKDYWSDPGEVLVKNYSLQIDGKIKREDEGWNYAKGYVPKKSDWTKKGDLNLDLKLNYDYDINWQKYSNIEQGINPFSPVNAQFRCLLIKVTN